MATPRDIRYLAFQALFQLDARGDDDADAIRHWLDLATLHLRKDAPATDANPEGEHAPPPPPPVPKSPTRGRRHPMPQAELTEVGWAVDVTDALRGPISEKDLDRAFDIARNAWGTRADADAALAELAPTWPAHRQPAVDRAIIRLAHHEMTAGVAAPKVAVNEAVELAKRFSTDRSPAFINGVLDKILRNLGATAPATDAATIDDAVAAPQPPAPDEPIDDNAQE